MSDPVVERVLLDRGKDLGTYHVRVEFDDGRGFIYDWNTSARYTKGSENCHPLDAERWAPTWTGEDDLIASIVYMFTDGNYGCDCNRALFLARAYQQDEPEDPPCGHTLKLKRLTVIRPDGSELDVTP